MKIKQHRKYKEIKQRVELTTLKKYNMSQDLRIWKEDTEIVSDTCRNILVDTVIGVSIYDG